MRGYGKVEPTFWTGSTGRSLRAAGNDEQLLALFLMLCPMANWIGIYHLPVEVICPYLGWDAKRAKQAMAGVCRTGFARYDADSEYVFVPEMAARQIGESLDQKDRRCAGVAKEWHSLRGCVFYLPFYERYKDDYHLPEPSPLQAPCKPLASHEHEHQHENEQEQEHEVCPGKPGRSVLEANPGTLDTSPAKAKRDKARPVKEVKPRQPDALFDAVAEVTSSDPKVSGAHIGRICKALRLADPPYAPDEVRRFPAAMSQTHAWFTGSVTLGTIEKYIGILRAKSARGSVVTPDDLAHGTHDAVNPFVPNTKTCNKPNCQRSQCVAARKGGE